MSSKCPSLWALVRRPDSSVRQNGHASLRLWESVGISSLAGIHGTQHLHILGLAPCSEMAARIAAGKLAVAHVENCSSVVAARIAPRKLAVAPVGLDVPGLLGLEGSESAKIARLS